MAGSNSKTGHKKTDERRQRNLASANASRERRREHISSMTEEQARLNEANSVLRHRLNMKPSGSVAPLHKHSHGSSSSSSSRRDVAQLGPGMENLLNRREMDGKAVVDLLDRAVSGSKGKGTPLDPEAARRLAAAARKAPKDAERPFKHYGKAGSSSKKR